MSCFVFLSGQTKCRRLYCLYKGTLRPVSAALIVDNWVSLPHTSFKKKIIDYLKTLTSFDLLLFVLCELKSRSLELSVTCQETYLQGSGARVA